MHAAPNRSYIVLRFSFTRVQPEQRSDGVGLPNGPHEILAAAAPLYDFSSPELKPWHLKATYQIFDWNGGPEEQGTWDYWKSSTMVSRTTWARPGSEHTVWRTAGGALYRKDDGSPLKYFERSIATNLLSPLPKDKIDDLQKMKLEVKMLPPQKPEVECVTFDPVQPMPSYFCFDLTTPALRMTVLGEVTTLFSQIVKTQGHYLARQIEVSVNKQKRFAVSVETIEPADPGDSVFTPSADAIPQPLLMNPSPEATGGVTPAKLIKRVQPDYPVVSKSMRQDGVVTLGIFVGANGKVKDVEVLASPSPSLASAAADAVKKWEYKPALLNGAPVEFSATVHVIFALGR